MVWYSARLIGICLDGRGSMCSGDGGRLQSLPVFREVLDQKDADMERNYARSELFTDGRIEALDYVKSSNPSGNPVTEVVPAS